MPFVGKKVGDYVESINVDEVRFVATVEHVWVIQNFNELTKGKVVCSPTFDGESKGGNKWRMEMLLKPTDDKSPNLDLEIQLVLIETESPLPVKTEFQMSILNTVNRIIWTAKVQAGEMEVNRVGFIELCHKIVQSKYLMNGKTLMLYCQVSTPTTLNLKRKCEEEEEYSAKKQLKSFFTNGDFADVILKTENTSFPASKLILAAHSPVFSAMFSSAMIESAENTVKIEDFSDELVKALLEFMYTGETRILEENPEDLLRITDKYQVMELKKKVETILLRRLKVNSAVDILIVAYYHSPTILKPKVVAFVNRNSKEIQKTQEFREMAKNFPEILLDLYAQK